MGPAELAVALQQTRALTLRLVADLSDAQLDPEPGPTVNPFRWELGHIAHFYDAFVCGHHSGAPRRLAAADELFNSFEVEHGVRWDLAMPDRAQTLAYLDDTQAAVLELCGERWDPDLAYLCALAQRHEEMHAEAFLYMRAALDYPVPPLPNAPAAGGGDHPGDAVVPEGRYRIGAEPGGVDFVFDNEKWAHEVELAPFRIARAPVTQGEYRAFVEAGGYTDERLWPGASGRWRRQQGLWQPQRWRKGDTGWEQRWFGRWLPLREQAPMVHVSWHEASAYCRFAGRRLPREVEWEVAAGFDPETGRMRRHPWGDADPQPEWGRLGTTGCELADVAAYPHADSPLGCRQMLGNVWEWTACPFYPYPGFVVDQPYKEYSAPWFGDRKVMRGGSFATPTSLVYNRFRNFFPADRSDVFVGFRTCAVD